jgi:uncharacterized protein (TIGR02099 family)
MTVSPALLSFFRRAARWLAGFAALATLGFATAAGLMYFWVLPNIADHRDSVASLMSRALGQRVTLEAVSGVWQQARPEFRLQGVRLYDHQGQPALYLPELEARFAWRSLLFMEPRFSHIELRRLSLGVRRARDGHIYVGGIPVNPADPDSGFADWLLRQGRVHVGEATLSWLDEVRDAPPLVLQDVDFTLDNTRSTRRLTLHAVPPASLAPPVTIEAELKGRDMDDIETWTGSVETSVDRVSFPHLATWMGVPFQPRQGWGALRVKLGLARGTIGSVSVDMDLREIETVLGDDLPALKLAQVRGQAMWRQGPGGQRVAFENLRVARQGGTLGAPFNVGLAWNESSREITAQSVSLGGWQSMLPSLPMDEALRERLNALQPQGRLDTLRFGWLGAQPGLDNFSVEARFSGLGVKVIGDQPGVLNLSGRVEGNAQAGEFEIDSTQMVVSFPRIFREPSFGFDRFLARGSWKKSQRGQRLTLNESAFANRDLAGSAKGQYELIAGQPGVIDLSAHLERAMGTAVHRYFPGRVGDQTVGWIRDGVVAGYSDNVRLRLKGDLRHFPFDRGDGVFRVEAKVKDAVIDYVSGWPRIEGIQGDVLFEGKRMEVTARQARIYGTNLVSVKAIIPDLLHHEELLEIDGQANGPIQDFIRFANSSPVGERLRGFTDTLDGSGSMRLALNMTVPLRHSHDTTLTGRLSFVNDSLFPSGLPRLDQVEGDIDFTQDSLSVKGITAQFLGGALRISSVTDNGKVQIQAQGNATAAGMASWLGPAWGQRLAGQTAWRGQLDLEPAGERIRIESTLVGLDARLPLPLVKTAPQPLPLLLTSWPQGNGRLHEIRLGNTVGAIWHSAQEAGLSRGEIRFGGPAVMPELPGLRLAGKGRAIDITGWMALLPEGKGGDELKLSSIDLNFDAFDMMGRRFEGVRLQARSRNGLLRGQVTGREVDGVLTYRPAGTPDSTGTSAHSAGSDSFRAQPARVSAQFKRLTIPGQAPAVGEAGGINMEAEDFPVLDLTVEDFRLQARPLGRLAALARGSPQGLVIDSLRLTHPDSVFHMSGLWRDGAPSETRAELALDVLDAGKFLGRFDFPGALRGGVVAIQGNATWVGSPADFSFDTLAGQLSFTAKNGQFLKINPGAGKLLGVLSLQSLPRRLSFDFRDIFNQGYAFDDVGATLRIARGVVYSDDLKMRGPAAKVDMSGMADLNQETVQLRVKVIPKLSESVALAGALIGGPLAGAGVLAAQKLLRDPFEASVSKEYMVTGAW